MKVVVAGGSGFLGSALTTALTSRGHETVILSRHPPAPSSGSRHGVRHVAWRPDSGVDQATSDWSREIDGADAVVNLAGASLADDRWTAARKTVLRDSRINSTRQLVGAVRTAARAPTVFLQGSAVGYYGTSFDQTFDESSRPGSDFLATLCVDWEREGQAAAASGCRVVTLRTAVALAREGGALKKMLLPFQLGVGGPIASGRQWFPWIHRDDWVAMVVWSLETPAVTGPVNVAAPSPVTNAEFTRAFGTALHRPAFIPMPGFALRLLFGELADAGLINGQRVMPKRATDLGFRFKYAEIAPALKAAVTKAKHGDHGGRAPSS
jgi:uncharacterized protein (TIGR01777 family)